ncbi:MAG: hypothetical protein FJX36_00310 [Alphaproteobacteria bacterium]|nr:hypothetical protein [Alphaproteobacteria bacterium]
MSHRTVLNRWRRYQVARLEGLIEGLAREARRIPAPDCEHQVLALGAAMDEALEAYCEDIAASVDREVAQGAPLPMPDLAFERL